MVRCEKEGVTVSDELAVVIKKADAKNFMEGVEHCREYVRLCGSGPPSCPQANAVR